jgi:hypothetical protein
VAVIVALAVGTPVIVTALLNGSDIVKVNDAVKRYRSLSSHVACSFTGVDHGHGFVPAPERGHAHARDHAHGMAEAFWLHRFDRCS